MGKFGNPLHNSEPFVLANFYYRPADKQICGRISSFIICLFLGNLFKLAIN